MLERIIHSRFTSVILGIILIAYAIYNIYEEFYELTHEHILIVVGILLLISGIGHLNEGIYNVAHTVSPNKELPFLKRVSNFFHLRSVRLVLGTTILITAAYGLYEDYEKIHSKSVSMSVGIFMMLLPMMKVFLGGENVVKGIKKKPGEGEKQKTA
ncbi:MAG: hypothetical protein P8P74_04680 [Crocinitomicaceae bacterium]|nr:hypothetical protein [Crocinitomicaceae bacterium]